MTLRIAAALSIVAASALVIPAGFPAAQPTADTSIHVFRAHVLETAVADMRRRIRATRWPDRETVADQSQAFSSPG
jgi:hypothetical protein